MTNARNDYHKLPLAAGVVIMLGGLVAAYSQDLERAATRAAVVRVCDDHTRVLLDPATDRLVRVTEGINGSAPMLSWVIPRTSLEHACEGGAA